MRKSFLFLCIYSLLLTVYLGIGNPVVNADETGVGKDQPYVINIGDQLFITVVGYEKELTDLVTVRPDGVITYPVVGDVRAAGLTATQLSLTISNRLSDLGYYKDPKVTVQLKEFSQEIVYIFGSVKDPGQKRFPSPANVVEALAAAGGYEETADLASAKIIKKREKVISIDLERFLKEGIIGRGFVSDELLTDSFALEDGDVLIIPSAIKEDRISIIGHVHQPGQHLVKAAISLIEALALAGGALETTADLKHIRIIKPDGSVTIADATRVWTETYENHPPSESLSPQNAEETDIYYQKIQPGDSVFVPEKGRINILGSVINQGQFPVDGEISVIEALALSGVGGDANLKRLRIVRSDGEQIIIDASEIWKQSGQEAEEMLSPGDTLIVPRAFRLNWAAISTVALILSTLYAIFK